MQSEEQIKARDAIRKYIRHRPERFEEARQWILGAFPPPKAGTPRGAPSKAYRQMEALVLDWRAKLSGGWALPRVASKDRDREALRVLLTAWLVDSDAHPESWHPVSSRREEYGELPHLDVGELLRLGDKFAFRDDPRWIRVVAEALEHATYETEAQRSPIALRFELAWLSYEWACQQSPELAENSSGPGRVHWEYLNEHGSPMYKGRHSLPGVDTWCKYAREYRLRTDGPRSSHRHGRPHGKSIVDESDL